MAEATPASSTSSLTAAKRHLAWLLPLFLLVLSLFAMRNLIQKSQDLNNALEVRTWVETSLAINQFVHEIQKERGLASGYIASHGANFRNEMLAQQKLADTSLQRLEHFLNAQEGGNEAITLAVQQNLAELQQLRPATSALRFSREFVVDRYTQMIDALFDLQARFGHSNAISPVYRQQLALFDFMQAKEYAGRERALLSAMLSDHNFSAGRIATFQRVRAVEETHRLNFSRLAQARQNAALHDLLALPSQNIAQRIRQRVIAAGLRSVLGDVHSAESQPLPEPEQWFSAATAIIDGMKQLEDQMGGSIAEDAEGLAKAAQRELAISALLTIISFILASVLISKIQRGRQVAEQQLSLADAVFFNSVEAILVTDAQQRIVEINPAFSEISGYQREEIIGQSPRLLRSGKHDDSFYQRMWQHIANTDHWEGEIWNRRRNGDIYPALLSIAAVRNPQGEISNYTGMIFDLSQHQKIEMLMEQLRTFDALTGLPNRDAWLSTLDQAIANGQRKQGNFSVLEIDLDRFKLINDSLGHLVGDKVLVEVAQRLRRNQRKQDIVARPGSNRFSVLLYEVTDAQLIGGICEKLLASFDQPFDLGDNCIVHVTASIGIAIYPNDGQDAKTLMMAAESALYSAKADGRNLYKFYAREMNELGAQLFKLERMLRRALENGEFFVVYQPQIAADDERLIGVEALLRWKNPELGMVSPVQFIPVAEETGLIVPIGEWVMRTACAQAQRWRSELGLDIPVAVNLSARQFQRSDLLATVQSALDASALPQHLLELEITEGLLMADPIGAIDIIRGLNFMGVRTALDDFGTGYSSLAYLKLFPLNRLKIDRAFVRDLPDNESDRAISQTVVTLGLNLKLEVLAEGVETEAQRDYLRGAGCQVFQGFLYSKPLTAEELETAIAAGKFQALPAASESRQR